MAGGKLLVKGGATLLTKNAVTAGEKKLVKEGTEFAAKEAPKLLEQGVRRFSGDEAVQHFTKHAGEVMNALGKKSYNLAQYLDDANHVIRTGQWVPELNAYVKLIGGPGSAKAAFVGINRVSGAITTFHIKTVKELAKKAPSLGWIL